MVGCVALLVVLCFDGFHCLHLMRCSCSVLSFGLFVVSVCVLTPLCCCFAVWCMFGGWLFDFGGFCYVVALFCCFLGCCVYVWLLIMFGGLC